MKLSTLQQFVATLTMGVTLCLGLHSTALAAGDANPDNAPMLFSPSKPSANTGFATTQTDTAVVKDRQVVRSNSVILDINLLSASADLPPGVSAPGRVITLNLFDNVTFVAEADRVERTKHGITWIGHVRGVEMSAVIIVTNDDIVSGNISMPGARYHIRYSGGGVHAVQEIDQSKFPEDEPMVPVPDVQSGDSFLKSNTQADAQADSCSTIDVMVVYNATSTAAVGGTAAMQSLIDLAVAETNQSYLNSGITQRIRLVHSEEVSYNETNFDWNAALNCVTNPSDGCLDNVPVLRNTYGADLVSFWVENQGYCGLGWFMSSISPSFAPNGYNVVSRTCATGYYSFGHEMGHNMGAMHDIFMDTGTTPYAYAHGYTYTANPATPWRTVMAYNNACSAVGLSCSRLQFWSNPGITNSGVPMGNASADNHQTLNNTACTVANFRTAVTPQTIPGAPTIGSALAGNTQATVNFTPPAAGSPILSYTVTSNPGNITATGTASPITVNGLTNGTAYTFTVTATNAIGTGLPSATSNSVTPYAALTRLFENFDTVTPASLPLNWQSVVVSGGSWATHAETVQPVGIAAHSPANLVYFNSYDVASGMAANLVSPSFSLAGVTSGKVAFWMYRDGQSFTDAGSTNNDRVEVYINTSANLSGATLLGTVNRLNSLPPVVASDGWYPYSFDIPGTYAGAANYVIVKGISGWGNDIHIDDISITAKAIIAPTTSTNPATNVTATGAFLHGTVADGGASTTVVFNYGLTSGYGSTISGGTVSAGAGNTSVSAAISSLACNTSYHFRVVGTNSAGTSNGSDVTFTTSACPVVLPTATTNPASAITANTAILNGTVADGGAVTSVTFNYGLTTGYGSTISGGTVSAGAGSTAVSAAISSLVCNTTYHFRVAGTNSTGTGNGGDATFTSGICPLVSVGGSGFQMVQAGYDADDNGADILLLAGATVGPLTVSKPGSISIKGGYDSLFSLDNGLAAILGQVVLKNGTTRFEKVIVK